jgi:hypothetical protein
LANDVQASDAAYPNLLRLVATSAFTYSLPAGSKRVI